MKCGKGARAKCVWLGASGTPFAIVLVQIAGTSAAAGATTGVAADGHAAAATADAAAGVVGPGRWSGAV